MGVGQTLYSGDVSIHTNSVSGGFEMRDLTRGGHYVTSFNNTATEGPVVTDADNNWGNNTASDPNSAASDAQYGAQATWDFYQSLGRNGIANDGVGARAGCTTAPATTTPSGTTTASA